MNTFRFFFAIPSTMALVGFGIGLLDVEDLAGKRFARVLKILFWALFGYMFIALIPSEGLFRLFGVITFYALALISVVMLLWAAVYARRQKHPPGNFFLLGQIPVVVVLQLYLLRNFKLIPEYDFFGYLILGAIIWETSVTLFCLISYVKRVNVLSIPKIRTSESEEIPTSDSGEQVLEDNPNLPADQPRPELLELFDRIKQYFEKEKPYLGLGLRLESLAEELKVQPYLVSEAINSCSEMHFFDFVNSYRIAHARFLLKNEDVAGQFSQDAIAAMCGFSNKSSFYSAFKKFTGMTPLQYRRS